MKKSNNKAYLKNNKAVSCKEGAGRFQGWAQGVITPPKGYKLEGPATYAKYGTTTWVGCGKKGKPVGSPISEEITVKFVPLEQ